MDTEFGLIGAFWIWLSIVCRSIRLSSVTETELWTRSRALAHD